MNYNRNVQNFLIFQRFDELSNKNVWLFHYRNNNWKLEIP
jgi:hypothetical protein